MATYAVELPVGQNPQQAGLGFTGHIADLVQEKGAPVGLFEAPFTAVIGARKCPLFVTEKL